MTLALNELKDNTIMVVLNILIAVCDRSLGLVVAAPVGGAKSSSRSSIGDTSLETAAPLQQQQQQREGTVCIAIQQHGDAARNIPVDFKSDITNRLGSNSFVGRQL